jgi:DedD protein
LEQQVKERLTGGVILVVLLVLLVPELLTGPRSAPQPPQAQPDQAPMRSYTMELGDSTHANSAPVAASTTASAAGESAAAVASVPSSAPAQTPVDTPTAAPPVVEQPAVARAAIQPPPPVVPAAPAHPAATQHGATLWTVQLGTFSSRENAVRLVSGLKSHGFSASVSEATKSGHKVFRVRVGAERDRAAAQKLLGRLTAAGEKGGEVVAR